MAYQSYEINSIVYIVWFHLEGNNLVQIGLAFPQDQFHLVLMFENCTGDICLARKQQKSRRSKSITFLQS